MKNEKILKRPKSGKPFLLRPLKTSLKEKFNEKEQFNNFLFDNKNDYTNRNIGNNKYIDSFINKEIKNTYNDILEENLKKFNDINSKKDKLKNINLIEKNIEDLYDWSNLLNNSRPISCYTLNSKPLNLQNDKKYLKHTVIDCDQNTKNIDKINIKKKRLLMAMYSPRNNSFYFSHSKTMSNFYKKNKINIAERAKFLKPKLKSNSFKLKNQIKTQRILSARKERELSNKLNSDEINLEKKDLITATERKNPFPLLQSIFKQIYYKDDNHKLFTNNTIKTSRTDNNNIDKDNQIYYDRNDKLLKKVKYKNKSDIFDYNYNNGNKGNSMGSGSNLILSYYNKDDAYIQIFNRIIGKKNKYNNDNTFNAFNEKENIYNPILQNFEDNFNPNKLLLMKKNIQNKNNEKKEDDFNTNNNSIINKNTKNLKNIRPKTGFRPSSNLINNPWSKRRKASNINKYKESIEQMLFNYDPSTDLANSSNSNSFPIKTLSYTGNTSYDKINKILKEKKLDINVNNIKYDHIKPSKELKKLNNNNTLCKKRNIKKNLSFNKIYNTNRDNTNKIKNNNKWNNDNVNCNKKNKKSVNVYDFSDVVNNLLNENDNKNYTLNYYKSMGGKHYSSSNNVNVKKIRNDKNKKLKNLYTDFCYSKDDQENEHTDGAFSKSKENNSFQKI